MTPLAVLLLLLGMALLVWRVRAHTVVFVARFEGGRVTVRGRAPLELVSDLEDIARRTGAKGRVVATSYRGEVDLEVTLDEPAAQRVRNAVLRFPLARLRASPRRPG